ncbi:MAG: C40 family peptidase [Verrucomicrobia bacterium]|nr:C40 family peptidase [Verrucomicrobiota bacterium]
MTRRVARRRLRILPLAALFAMQLTQLFGTLPLEHLDKEGTAFHRELARKINARLEQDPAALKTALDRLRHLVLSDRVGFYFDVTAEREDGRVVLRGDTERPEFKRITREVFRHLGFTSVVDRVGIVPDGKADPDPFGVATAAQVLTWSQPDLKGTPMDEALFGEPVYVLKELPRVLLIKTITGYWGYASRESIRRLPRAEFIRLLNAPKATLMADHLAHARRVPSGCRLILQEWGDGPECRLEGVNGESLAVPKSICQRTDRDAGIARLLAYARTFLDAPYQLGGKNRASGIDCSGLVQLSYRTLGVNLARDAKQQYLGGHLILPCVREALLPGDALYFMGGAGQVDHVALYLGNDEVLHATGNRVKLQSTQPSATNYLKRLDRDFIGAKRFWW